MIRRSVVLVAIAVLLAFPGSASAVIVLQKGMAGVTISMTKAKVRSVLGTPTKVKSGKNEFGKYTTFVYPTVTITFQGADAVTSI